MTLRDYLDRRSIRAMIIGALVYGVAWSTPHVVAALAAFRFPGGLVLPFVMLVGAISRYTARCPRCRGRLSYLDFGSKRASRPPDPRLSYCGACGLHMNDEMGAAGSFPGTSGERRGI